MSLSITTQSKLEIYTRPDTRFQERLVMGRIPQVGCAGIFCAFYLRPSLATSPLTFENTQGKQISSIEGIYVAPNTPNCNRSRVQDLWPSNESQFFAYWSITNPRALRFILYSRSYWQAPLFSATTNAYDTSWDDETESEAIWPSSSQNDCGATTISPWLFTHRSRDNSYWYLTLPLYRSNNSFLTRTRSEDGQFDA